MTNEKEKAANHNKIFCFSFELEKQIIKLLNYQFKFMDCETVM